MHQDVVEPVSSWFFLVTHQPIKIALKTTERKKIINVGSLFFFIYLIFEPGLMKRESFI